MNQWKLFTVDNMSQKLKIDFVEAEYFAEDRTGRYIKGYEPAIIEVDGKKKLGRVIDIERLRDAEYLETILCSSEIPYSKTKIHLEELIGKDEGGKKWLESLQRMHVDSYGMPIDTEFFLNPLEMIPIVYTMYKENKEDSEESSRNSKSSNGLLVNLPQRAVYAQISPPMEFSNGKSIGNLYYRRNALLPDKKVFSTSQRDFCNKEDLRQVEGVLIGEIHYYDMEAVYWQRGGTNFGVLDFPITSFLEVCYPVSLRDRIHNPLSIRVWFSIESDAHKNDKLVDYKINTS